MHDAPPAKSHRRRLILGTLGAAACATATGFFGWWQARRLPSDLATTPATNPGSPVAATKVEPAASSSPVPADSLTRAWFEPYLNTEFKVKVSALTTASVTLVDVGPARTISDKDHHVDYTSFSLIFRGAKSLPEESKVYHIDHGVLGAMDLFLNSVGKSENEVRLEAVFTQRI